MIRIAVCDDSHIDAQALYLQCQTCNLNDDLQIVLFEQGEEMVKAAMQTPFHIVFLDVDMPGQNGIQIGKQLRELNSKLIIIFVTNYPQYAIEAYDCEAFHYLLKPTTSERVSNILKRAVMKLGVVHKNHIVHIQNRTISIPLDEIYYIEYCRKHIIYHLANRVFETTGRFRDVIGELQKYGFYQIHQGYIVNFSKVKDIRGYSVILTNDQSIMVSVRKKSEVLGAYTDYVENYQ